MAKTMRVRAIKPGFGGIPSTRRRPGEVFNVLAERKDGKPNTAAWYEPVAEQTPIGKAKRALRRSAAEELVKVRGEYVPAVHVGVSGGGQPAPDAGQPAASAPGSGHDLV